MKLLIIIYCFFISFISCDILREAPFEVVSWTPGDGYHNTEDLVVSLLLSHPSDRARTEQSFFLSEEGRPVRGTFSWDDRRLYFWPSSPLEANNNYTITLNTSAQNNSGLSLENKFTASFTTRRSGSNPRVISVIPEEKIITESRDSIAIHFSEPVSISSCINDISFYPAVNGSWRLEDNGYTASFTPLDPWKTGLSYRVDISSSFMSDTGRIMGDDYIFVFNIVINNDFDKPVLLSAWALHDDNSSDEIYINDISDYLLVEYDGWETSSKLKLVFSKPVDTTSVRQKLIVEPNVLLVMETDHGYSDSVVFRFFEKPEWQSQFLFRLNTGVRDESGNETDLTRHWKIVLANENSKPPALIGIRLPLSPGKLFIHEQQPVIFTPRDLHADLNFVYDAEMFPFAKAIPFWIELYFDTAPKAKINLFTLMNVFRLESTNSALSFSPRYIIDSHFTWINPVQGWESYERVEIQGYITNTINSGVVTFRIGSGLEDNKGNKSTQAYFITLLK